MALPLLPGNTFNRNLSKEKYHKSHYFDSKNEVNFMFGDDKIGIGGDSLPGQRVDAPTSKYPYGDGSSKPAWIAFDKQVLFFDGYFQESVNERREEQFRIRQCKVMFYLEDDTIQVIEPRTKNSCLPQGTIIRRHRIAKPAPNDHLFYTVHDFNVGEELRFYGKVIRIVGCDQFTHNFLRKLGVQIGQPEKLPTDSYTVTRKAMEESMQPLRPYERQDKLKQFLDHDRHVLRFYCYWDDSESLYGDRREMIINYFLADNTIEIREVIPPNAGRDASGCFLKRQKLPKMLEPLAQLGTNTDRTLLNVLGHLQRGGRYLIDNLKTGEVHTDFYTEHDLVLGGCVNVYGRKFIITDMDYFTKEYYRTRYGLNNFDPIPNNVSRGEPIEFNDPPYNGWGLYEDSLANCHGLMPQPPKRDFIKFMEKDRKGLESHVLRFKARMITDKNIDKERRFIISFFLSDDSMLVFEPAQKNSGFLGGKFLERGRIKKPGQEKFGTESPKYYNAGDLHVGAIVEINKTNFFVEDADEYAYRYMERNSHEFPQSNIDRIMLKLRNKFPNQQEIEMVFRQLDTRNTQTISFRDLNAALRKWFSEEELTEHEICTLARYYALRAPKEIDLFTLLGVAQQYLRKVNFDEFTRLKEACARSDRQGQGSLPEEEMMKICRVFHLPLSQDLLYAIFDQCRPSENGGEFIDYNNFLQLINWRTNAYPAPVSDVAFSNNSSEFIKGKCVEDVNYVQLVSDITGA